MAEPSFERIPVGILTQNEGKFAAAMHGIDPDLFEVVQITDTYSEIQAPTSLEIATFSARAAAQDHGIPVIREDHSIHFEGMGGLPGPYAKYAEKHMGVAGLIQVLSGRSRQGCYMNSAAMADPRDGTVGTTTQVSFSVAKAPRGDLQSGWPEVIMLEGEDRTLAEYPESERLDSWSNNYRRLAEFLLWRQDRVLYITGPHAAGKTEAATVLLQTQGYPYVDLGPSLRQIHSDSGSEANLGDWIAEQEAIHGDDVTDALLSARVIEARNGRPHPLGFAVIGSRSVKGLTYIDEQLNPSASMHIHVDAPPVLLHDRYCEREQKEPTIEEFSKKLADDEDMGLNDLESVADRVIRNDDDKGAFHATVSEAVRDWEFMLPSDEIFYID